MGFHILKRSLTAVQQSLIYYFSKKVSNACTVQITSADHLTEVHGSICNNDNAVIIGW